MPRCPSPRTLRLAALVLALMCLGTTLALWRRAFPIAALEFRVSRGEAAAELARTIAALGHPVDGYRRVVAFNELSDAKNFLSCNTAGRGWRRSCARG